MTISVTVLLLVSVVFTGCTLTPAPKKLEADGAVFQKPVDAVHKAAFDGLVVNGFDITKTEALYIEGVRPVKKWSLVAPSGGETVGVWLEPLETSRTLVHVDTAKRVVGGYFGLGQKIWNEDIIKEIERTLEKKE